MQAMISENMMMSELANNDLLFNEYQQKKYNDILNSIEKAKRVAQLGTDVEMDNHLKRLEKYHLKTNEWQIEPLENAEHDFVNDLLTRYVMDLRERIKLT